MLSKFLVDVVDKIYCGNKHAVIKIMILALITIDKSMITIGGPNRLTNNTC